MFLQNSDSVQNSSDEGLQSHEISDIFEYFISPFRMDLIRESFPFFFLFLILVLPVSLLISHKPGDKEPA